MAHVGREHTTGFGVGDGAGDAVAAEHPAGHHRRRFVVTQTAQSNPRDWLLYLNTILVRWINESAAVVADGADQMSSGEHTVDSCFKTASRLADIALLNGVEYATTVFAGPGFTMLTLVSHSAWYDGPKDRSCAHSIGISATEPLSRLVADDPIPTVRIGFEVKTADGARLCPDRVLPAGTEKFRVVVSRLGIHSGCYTGRVVLTPVTPATGDPDSFKVEIEL